MLTEEQKSAFESQGYLIVAKILQPQELNDLSDMVDQLLDGRLKPEMDCNGKRPVDFYTFWEPGMQDRADLPRRQRIRLMSWMAYHHPYFWRLACHPAICQVVSAIYGTGVKFFSDTVFMKPARHGVETAMHQDIAFWPKLEPKAINVWLAIDPATVENGCLHIIPGTHTKEIPHCEHPVQKWLLRDEDVEIERLMPIELQPGDAIFFDSGLVHRSYPNRSDRSRRSFAPVYVSADVKHLEPWTLEYGFKSVETHERVHLQCSQL